ncbi:hypothetical protein Hanom_Chr09g00774481 [Helianthus anomalus]
MFSGVERHASFAKAYNISMNETDIFLNHVTNEFQLTQMVYAKHISFTKTYVFFKTCMSFMTSDRIVLVTIRD